MNNYIDSREKLVSMGTVKTTKGGCNTCGQLAVPASNNLKLGSEVSLWSKGDTVPNITRQSGPIINNPQIYNLFVGDWSSEANKTRAQRLDQFTTDLLNSTYMTLLAQYGCIDPGAFVKSVVIAHAGGIMNDKQVQQLIQQAITDKKISEPKPGDVLMLYLSDEIGIEDTELNILMCSPGATVDNSFGYHNHFKTLAGNKSYYGVIPGLTDGCLINTCMNSINCSLKLDQPREERQTQVAAHEIVEILSNPESNAWYDKVSGQEIADICNGYKAKIKVADRTWAVQEIYSKSDDQQSGGLVMCKSSTGITSPLPGGLADAEYAKAIRDAALQNKYNVMGGMGLLVLAACLAAFGKRGIFGILGYGIAGFVGGIALTSVIKKILTPEQKQAIKQEIQPVTEQFERIATLV